MSGKRLLVRLAATLSAVGLLMAALVTATASGAEASPAERRAPAGASAGASADCPVDPPPDGYYEKQTFTGAWACSDCLAAANVWEQQGYPAYCWFWVDDSTAYLWLRCAKCHRAAARPAAILAGDEQVDDSGR